MNSSPFISIFGGILVGASLVVFTSAMAPVTILLSVLVVAVMAQEHLASTGVAKSTVFRIVRGQNAQQGQFPWQAYIECIRSTFLASSCGGSLISSSHILTAAHCVNSIVLCQVSLGMISLQQRGFSYYLQTANIKIHEDYKANSYVNDIAIIRLRSPIQFTGNIRPIRLAREFQNSRTLSGFSAIVSGWGKTRDNEKGVHDFLQYANVKIMPAYRCKSFYMQAFKLELTNGHVCTDYSISNVCSGDSGGPLVIYEEDNIWTLIGIVSLGVSPCEEGTPSVFTAVANYLPWIEQNTFN